MKSDIEIAQAARLRPIVELARERLGIPEDALQPYGRYKAKISLEHLATLGDRPDGKLILVTAGSPTPAGIVRILYKVLIGLMTGFFLVAIAADLRRSRRER